MKMLDMAKMQEATRLTRAGRLNEALAILQGASAGPSEHHTPASKFIDGEVVSEQKGQEKVSAGVARALHGLNLPGTGRSAFRESDLAPADGEFIGGAFSSSQGARHYKLYIPSAAKAEPRPLIVMLHGCTQTAEDFAVGTRMNFVAESQGCYVAYPEQPQGANVSKCWNWFRPSDQTRGTGEPALIAGITRQVAETHNIDASRVYVAGLSAGGAAAAIMGETYPDIYAAVGVHSGLACGAAHDLPSAFSAMRGAVTGGKDRHTASAADSSRKPTIVFHGDSDSTVHPRNGAQVIARARGENKMEMQSERSRSSNGESFSRSVHRDETGTSIFELWELHGAGHYWSGGSATGSFASEDGPNASAEMVRFFLQHRLLRTASFADASANP